MKIVYFNPNLSARAPDILGVFCAEPSGQWLSPGDIGDALEAGEDVEIRQASYAEIERAEGIVILYGIEMKLARQVGALLDSSDAHRATDTTAAAHTDTTAAHTDPDAAAHTDADAESTAGAATA